MASPMTTGSPAAYGWPPAPPNQQPQGPMPANDADEMGMQVRPMALKVLYTFDKDSRVNCLARWPHTLQVQVVPLDEQSWIGIVDLRLCIQAIAQGSPELASQTVLDYAIYAVDYSEPDTPLVGQGMLSWVMDPAAAVAAQQFDEGPKMVTGRVTKNMMALFGKGVRETLEVRLKLSEVSRMARTDSNSGHRGSGNGMNATSQGQGQVHNAPTPTDTSEWNSFLQANPMLGRSASISTMQSPSLAPVLPDMSAYPPSMSTGMAAGSFDMGPRAVSRPGSRPNSRQSSKSAVAPSHPPVRAGPPPLAPHSSQQQQQQQQPGSAFPSVSPPPIAMANDEVMSASTPPPETNGRPARPARPPRSRSRVRVPTGRPRGRPRKSQLTDGNTSAAEEAPTDADGDDAHKKKRVKTTKADYPTRTSLDSAPDSLRVAASTSGALRTLRPVLPQPPSTDGPSAPGSHLQELPRAPTPVPQGGGAPGQHHARKLMAQRARRESLANLEPSSFADSYARSLPAGSPTDSMAPSPENYTPENSPPEMNSSPPVPRTTSYVPQSSPIPSSPPLPAMRMPPPDSGFMSGGMEDLLFGDDENAMLNDKFLPPPTPIETAAPTPNMEFSLPLPPPTGSAETGPLPPAAAPVPSLTSSTSSASSSTRSPKRTNRTSNKRSAPNAANNSEQYPFLAMIPGPPELLPTTVLYNPPQPKPRAAKPPRANSMVARAPPRPLERSHSEPAHPASLPDQLQADAQAEQRPLSQLRHQSISLPTDGDKDADASKTDTSQLSQLDIHDDIKELSKLITATHESPAATPSEAPKSPQTQPTLPQQPAAEMARFMSSLPPLPFPSVPTTVPASDPVGLPPLTLPAPPPPPTAFSEAPCPPSDADVPSGRSNKNLVRKAAIRERLKKAIQSGEMPPYCQNCGAIETPTWRKMWTQEHEGEPGYYNFQDQNCPITFIEILERDAEGRSTRYRLVRKSLNSHENGKLWTQMLLCNPCGIWVGKFRSHRPRDRWDKDLDRLEQTRTNFKTSRPRKSRAKSDPQTQLTSEAYLTTDPAGPEDNGPPANAKVPHIEILDTPPPTDPNGTKLHKLLPAPPAAPLPPPPPPASTTTFPKPPATTAESNKRAENENENPNNSALGEERSRGDSSNAASLQQPDFLAGSNQEPASGGGGSAERRRGGPGSTHSRGSGTADSPIAVDDQFGTTRRLLFPSPRKEGVLKVLGELAVNVIGTVLGSPKAKANPSKFEDTARSGAKLSGEAHARIDGAQDADDMEDLFGTPPPPTARPSTPPPNTSNSRESPAFASGPFKTPTRPTPSHRPITRSVSKSIVRSTTATTGAGPQSPVLEGLMLLAQRTPSKTPRSVPVPGSASRQRRTASVTPARLQRQQQQQQSLHVPLQLDGVPFDTPFTSTLNQLLSEANDFTTGSPSHGLTDLDLATFANLDSDGLTANFGSVADDLDFGSYLDTDLVMPSSSPLVNRKNGGGSHKHHSDQLVSMGGEVSFEASESLWSDFNDAMDADV
ncbi:gata transcription factor [Sporothrix schenckii 1099-18]|uniref:Gata transcription factor n=1 Tax=Sporothrix schenckii 1099-18 TaxID=1397361 RepID=A0A0F2M1K9_SPOSC|nr:gata transcription factor [Sporothrix schenckii 1099-18]KJR82969.1 gata transcription factor [Sporothrix schenckii 1099-18]